MRLRIALSAICLALACAAIGLDAVAQPRPRAGAAAAPGTIGDIVIQGNQRIEAETIRSYLLVTRGDRFDEDALSRSVRALFATGLFQDAQISRDGSTLVVRVVENPIVNRIAFEGNRRIDDDALRGELQLRPRAVFTPSLAQADRQRLQDLYARRGRYAAQIEPRIIRLDQNRVDVVFEITEGDVTLISRIQFVGNTEYSDGRLREVIASREQAFWRILSTSDTYDQDRLNADRELLRRFYLRNGYADFEVLSATAELAPDRSGFFLTFVVREGPRYRFGPINVESRLRGVDADTARRALQISEGDIFDGEAVDRNATRIQESIQNRGFAFVDVRPRVDRDREQRIVTITYEVTEAPRVFVERIDIVGNSRTQDRVIRREFRVAEGDPFNAAQLRRSQQRLRDLGYFSNVTIQPSEGSAPDRAILTTQVTERSTGELTIGGGFATDAGFLADFGIRERNFVGSGVDARINATLAQRRSQVDLSITDPYFLDRNLVAGFDAFHIRRDSQRISSFDDTNTGAAVRVGFSYTENLRQSLSYTISQRDVFNVDPEASLAIQEQRGVTLLSALGQTFTIDFRDSRIEPRDGFIIRIGNDLAGLGGDVRYLRTRVDGTYYIPLERFLGDPEFVIAVSAGVGHLAPFGGRDERIVDRFFLGGDNLRGFASGGAGPRDLGAPSQDSLGGRTIWTQSTEFRFPLPVSADLGLTGRAFVDVGSLSGVPSFRNVGNRRVDIRDDASPRVGAGVGVSWRTPFGLINLDFARAVVKESYDDTQVFRFGFGTRF
jgi:outer membrane protein insertion porin family